MLTPTPPQGSLTNTEVSEPVGRRTGSEDQVSTGSVSAQSIAHAVDPRTRPVLGVPLALVQGSTTRQQGKESGSTRV